MRQGTKHESNEKSFDATALPSPPDGWCWAQMKDVGEIKLGRQRSPEHHNGEHMRPYLRVANVFENRIDIRDVLRMNFTPAEFETFQLRFGDILLNEGQSLELIGRAAIYRDELPGACFQNTLVRFRSRTGVEPHFALYLFLYYLHNQRFQRIAKWTTNIAHLGAGRFAELEFPLAPLNEQRRIVAKIEELFSDLEAGVAALTRARANLKRYRASVLKAAVEGALTAEWRTQHPQVEPASKLLARILTERRRQWEADQLAKFEAAGKQPPNNWQAKYVAPSPPDTSDLPELPKGWCWVSLDSLCSLIADIDHNMPKAVENGVKFLSAKDLIDNGRLNFTDGVKLISEEDYIRLSRKAQPRRNDIIYSRIGARLGKARLVQTDEKFLVSYSCCTIRPLVVSAVYLTQFLDSGFVLARAMANSQSIGVPDLGLDRIKRFAVPLCSLEEQAEIVATVSEKLSQIESAEVAIDHSLRRAARLRQSILKQAFEGKLVPQDPTDEPASSLLGQITQIAATNLRGSRSRTK